MSDTMVEVPPTHEAPALDRPGDAPPFPARHGHAMSRDTVIALWLGHESTETTQIYLHSDLTIKERALARTTPPDSAPRPLQSTRHTHRLPRRPLTTPELCHVPSHSTSPADPATPPDSAGPYPSGFRMSSLSWRPSVFTENRFRRVLFAFATKVVNTHQPALSIHSKQRWSGAGPALHQPPFRWYL